MQERYYLCTRNPRQIGRLAQLVQSICLTSRGSAVRIRQRPLRGVSLQSFEAAGIFFRAFSSAGLEHLPYKQRVGGSNRSPPTLEDSFIIQLDCEAFLFQNILFLLWVLRRMGLWQTSSNMTIVVEYYMLKLTKKLYYKCVVSTIFSSTEYLACKKLKTEHVLQYVDIQYFIRQADVRCLSLAFGGFTFAA